MAESGLANMDMDYTKYLIGLCKQYYPNFLNYIVIFEMPWVMNGKSNSNTLACNVFVVFFKPSLT
jgi:CRAL/TRIO domain.